MTNRVTLTNYINSDSNLELEDQETYEKNHYWNSKYIWIYWIWEWWCDIRLQEFMSSKSAVQSLTKLHDCFEEHNTGFLQ